ncbi:MAG: ABC transporter ATP-binding protein [Propionibacteriales bacterium]|nr:ABC transporter ATP-binding protein [Propionibacteriales bacterium]
MNESSLRADGITVGYGGAPVLRDLDFTVSRGQFTAVIGPNGCGKSTLVKTLARTLRPTAGQVVLDGVPVERHRSKHVARRVGLLPQEPVVPDGITVEELVARGRHPYHSPLRQWSEGDDEAIASALSATGVDALAGRRVADLSGGQRQRAWIAMVLAQQTEFVLLDEPTSFLDLAHQLDVLRLCQEIRAAGRTVVAVLHDLNQAARYADRVVLMRDGGVVAEGTAREVVTSAQVEEVFGVRCRLIEDPESATPLMIPLQDQHARP